ncbi:hypothetical protein B0H10DRAFT_1944131 [Mycena sp. CBHHK59/15]|nr:hypothetical protein B0H10DRAFT_1944131 [Mycena sp. CBHHK59/15]
MHTWMQGSTNFLTALQRLCPVPDPANPMFASEYEKHLQFFLGPKHFEADFSIWYPTEKKLYLTILNKVQFVEAMWVVKVQVAMSVFKAAKELTMATSLIPSKCTAELDLGSGPQKIQRNTNDDRTTAQAT